MHVGAPGRPLRSAGPAAESSGGGKPGYGQHVVDHHELPDGFQGCRQTLTERIIGHRNVPVLLVLLTFQLPKVRSDLIGVNMRLTLEINRGSSLAKSGYLEAALAKFINF